MNNLPFYRTSWFRLTLAIILLVGLVQLAVFGLRGVYRSQQIEKQSVAQLRFAALGIAQVMENWVVDASASAHLMANQPGLIAGGPVEQITLLESYKAARQGLALAAIVSQDGEALATSERRCSLALAGCGEYLASSAQKPLELNLSAQSWFANAARKPIELIGIDLSAVLGGESEAGLVLVMPLKRVETFQSGDFKTPDLLVLLYRGLADLGNYPKLSASSSFFVLDQNDQLVAASENGLDQGLTESLGIGAEAIRSSQKADYLHFSATSGTVWHAAVIGLSDQWLVVYQQPEAEIYAPLWIDLFSEGGMLAAALILSFGVVAFVMERGLKPIQTILQAAREIADGSSTKIIRLPMEVHNSADLAGLVAAFDRMFIQLRDAVRNVDLRVQERTQVLERRTGQLQASVQVSRQAAQIRDLEQLLNESTRLVAAQFDFYHAGIFILDRDGEYAILRAANSAGGQDMLARQHKLKVGKEGIVGYVANTGLPRIALDVGADAVFFTNPDLPSTRSEMALPLFAAARAGAQRQVIGVLDVQSVVSNAFQAEDIEILQVLADQISLAMENARLFEESRAAFNELNRQFSSRTLQSWSERLRGRGLAYRYDRISTQPVAQASLPETAAMSPWVLRVPIRLQSGSSDQPGAELGYILLRRDESEAPWTGEEQMLVEDALAQIIPALENARLLEEIQQTAQLDTLVGQITTRLTESLTLGSVMSKTVSEIGAALGAKRVRIQLTDQKRGEQP